MNKFYTSYSYIPILAISPAEMSALEELPDKDKDGVLPVFCLKRWMTSNKLESTLKRIGKSIDDRPWIADFDIDFLNNDKTFRFTGNHPKNQIFEELKDLIRPENGFSNWCEFITENPNIIPCIRFESLENIERQIHRLASLGRGVVFKIRPVEKNINKHDLITKIIGDMKINDALIIYDLETVDRDYQEHLPIVKKFIATASKNISNIAISISSTSFPNGFSKQKRGHNSIYERLIFNALVESEEFNWLIYSDRGSARASKQDGGSGTPPPRIDYPLKKDWQFVRREFDDKIENAKEERQKIYIEIANEVVNEEYWIPELRLWGTQQIELTAEGNAFGIYSAQRATAARINIHLYNQLHYNDSLDDINTDEEWTD